MERADIYSLGAEDIWFEADDLAGEVFAIHDLSNGLFIS